jgi:multiple sugar transport system substrate-binding protein
MVTDTWQDGARPTAGLTRRQLVRRAGVAAAAVAVAGSSPGYAFAGPMRYARRSLKGELSIVQWNHVEPAYDAWYDKWATTWGETNDVEVTVDHVDYTRLPALAATEAKAQRGHDIFGFLSPPAGYADRVIDHSDVVRQIEQSVGPYGELGQRSTYLPRTKRYFGVSDSFVPAPTIWRHDLWNSIGESPATWEHVRNAAPKLRALGHPIGIGQSTEIDSNTALISFLMAFGSFIQSESNVLTFSSKRTVEAVKFMADLYREGEERQVLDWEPPSNNQLLLSGKGSLAVNAISVIRSAEDLQLPFANELWLWPAPSGPYGRPSLAQYTSVYSIWTFAKNSESAQRFLVDLCIAGKQATLASKLFNFPSFPGAVPTKELYQAAAADSHLPRGKYSILTTIATKQTRSAGYPGTTHPGVAEVLERFLIPRMFAQVSLGKLSAEDAVRATAWEMKRIWARWKATGGI